MKENSKFHIPHSTLKIDLIYLWVDGADPVWLAKKEAALAPVNRSVHNSAKASGRFDDNDELKFSLRSVSRFMPWVNHVYIITDGQVPPWLDTKNPRVSVTDHRDIIPAQYLPLFNSCAIELFAHRIPGLSEHFILANDDMFVGAPITPEFFFNANGDPIVIVRGKRYFTNIFGNAGFAVAARRRKLVGRRVMNALRLVFDLTGRRYYTTISHSFEPMRKSYMMDILARYGDELIMPTATTFRETGNIQRIFFPLYNNAMSRADLVEDWRLGARRTMLVSNESWLGILWRAILRNSPFVRRDFIDIKRGVFRKVSSDRPAVFCINNSAAFAKAKRDMEKLFPNKSEFET